MPLTSCWQISCCQRSSLRLASMYFKIRALIKDTLDDTGALLERLATLHESTQLRDDELRRIHAETVFLSDRTRGTLARAGLSMLATPKIDWERSQHEIRL